MKENLSHALAQIALRLSVIATNQNIALSVCSSEEVLKGSIRAKSNEIQSIAQSLLDIVEDIIKKGGAE